MSTVDLIHGAIDHLKAYLLSGTFVALGVDIVRNVTGSVGGAMSGAVAGTMNFAPHVMLSTPATLAVQGIGAMIAVVGAVLYLGNMWCGFVALREYRFNFAERGVLLKACGWSAAFLYVVTSAVIGVAVNAVYLAVVVRGAWGCRFRRAPGTGQSPQGAVPSPGRPSGMAIW